MSDCWAGSRELYRQDRRGLNFLVRRGEAGSVRPWPTESPPIRTRRTVSFRLILKAAPSQRDDSVEVPSPTQLSLAAIEFRRDLRMSAEAPIAAGESVGRSAAPAC